ncbi:MAG TPA: type I methionyl aminopeptidase [Miltoncostaeaceae bacterium]|nr:type I methionyl aminopeptidase [Miltoncostaeaceae bacterium]
MPTGPVPKTPGEVEAMAAAGAALAECLDIVAAEVRPGVTTGELDRIAEDAIRARGATPAFKGYHGFPGSICPSVNTEVVHAIPGPYALEEGDILSVDVGLVLDGWVADTARTLPVGAVADDARRLIEVTERALERGIAAARAGGHVGDIGHAVQTEVEAAGFSVVRSLVGHGVGRQMHEEPQVPNFGKPGAGEELVPGVVIAIEPMVNAGGPDVVLDPDGWTVRSADGTLSAHAEHTVAVTAEGPRILTRRAA